MSSTKRVILADGSQLLREMLHRALDKADHLQVVGEVRNHEELPASIEKYDPEWVIVSLSGDAHTPGWMHSCLADYPSVGFVFLSPDQNYITMKWQLSQEEEYSDLSLREFIYILEKDLQQT